MKLDGEPLAADASTCRAERSTARVLQVGKRHFRRLRGLAAASP